MVYDNLAGDYGSLGDSTSQCDVQPYGRYSPAADGYGRLERTLTIHNHYGEPQYGNWPRPDAYVPASSRASTMAAGMAGGVAGAMTCWFLMKCLGDR